MAKHTSGTDIFLSYARKDEERAEALARALSAQGWSVSWDRTVPPGLTWDGYIGEHLDDARCVVVAWSRASVESRWVREEAREGLERDVLVPVLFEEVRPPFGFRGIQAAALTGWDGAGTASAFQQLVSAISRQLGPPPAQVEAQRQEEGHQDGLRVAQAEPETAPQAIQADQQTETLQQRPSEVHPPPTGEEAPPPSRQPGRAERREAARRGWKLGLGLAGGAGLIAIMVLLLAQMERTPPTASRTQAAPSEVEPSGSEPAAAQPATAGATEPPVEVQPGETPTAEEDTTQRITLLLARADHAYKSQHLTMPEAESAFAYYRQVLALDPDNEEAKRGIDVILQRYLNWAGRAAGRQEYAQAEDYLQRAEVVAPGDGRIKSLRDIISRAGWRDRP